MVSAIIAAYNEEKTIGEVIQDISGHPDINEIIVVDDGSTDKTSEIALSLGATALRIPVNGGKAHAMDEGVKKARNSIIFFSDADIKGLTHEKISKIIDPVIRGEVAMNVGIRTRKLFFYNYLFRIFPIIGGERAIEKDLWFKVPAIGMKNFKIEIALNYTAKQNPKGMGFAVVEGISQTIKEQKFGWKRGLWNRMKMIGDVVSISYALYVTQSLKDLFKKKAEIE